MLDKPLVLGLHDRNHIDLNQLNIKQDYYDKIAYWYVHPPFGGLYDGRNELDSSNSKENIIFIQNALQILKNHNFKVQVAFNQFAQNLYAWDQLKKDINKYLILFGKPDAIITDDNFVINIKEKWPELETVRTVNESNTNILENNKLKYFDVIVLGDKNLFNIDLFKGIKEKYPHIKIELLISSCNFLCNKQCHLCYQLIQNYLEHHSIEEFINKELVFNEEYDILNNYIDFYKFSAQCLHSIPSTWDMNFNHILDERRHSIMHIVGHEPMSDKVKLEYNKLINNDFDIDKIIEYKKQMWAEKGFDIDIKI